jgi:hypothetical protein
MKKNLFFLFLLGSILPALIHAQDSIPQSLAIAEKPTGLAGYHIGAVQPILAIQQGETQYINEQNFYEIGFPIGVTFHTGGETKFDLEFVPFIKPYANSDKAYETHLLIHPGFLFPITNNFTFGLRAAFDMGTNQFGFTPLINQVIARGKDHVFFFEIVAPGRFGPEKNSGYTQAFAVHLGFGF